MRYWKKVCLGSALFAAMAIASSAQTFTQLASFTDGSSVFSSLIQGRDGGLYGISNNGGTGGYGTVFKVTPTGTLITMYRFCSQQNCADGFYPYGGLVLGTDGNFYGTAQNGGVSGMGVVFKITPGGAYSVLHSFSGTDGNYPDAGLALGSDKNFYGVTSSGGTLGIGTVFKMTPAGTLTTLHSFEGSDGYYPSAPLVQGTDGNFYGTTTRGGTNGNACYAGCGTVFKITAAGEFSSLHSFDFIDGQEPFAPLVQTGNGSFYGTTFSGAYVSWNGCSGGCGTVFEITTRGMTKTVHAFSVPAESYVGLTLASDGNSYGTTVGGGSCGDGVIYSVTPAGGFNTVEGGCFGGNYTDAMVQATNGKFYGTYAGDSGDGPGAIYSLDTGLGSFVTFALPSSKIGQTAQILGTGLTGATSVTFNGVAATKFSVVSDTYMTAVVPAGATTGAVVVATPAGNLTSNVSFRISK
jgi:uncharacterized repeat protein (TIGR03803 family)